MFSVGRMQIRQFRRFRQNGPFLAGDKNMVYQKHILCHPDIYSEFKHLAKVAFDTVRVLHLCDSTVAVRQCEETLHCHSDATKTLLFVNHLSNMLNLR